MRNASLVLTLLFTLTLQQTLKAQAPAIQWQKCYGSGYLDDPAHIEPTTDGGFIMTGYTYGVGGDVSGFHGNLMVADFWVAKLDGAGALQWARTLGGSSFDQAAVIHQAPDGGYVVAGESASTDGDVTTTGHGGTDYWVVKLDATGNIQWERSVGGEKNEYLYDLQFTPDGGYLLAGETESTGGQVSGNHGGRDFWIVKLNSAGNLVWQKCVGGSKDDEAYGAAVQPDGSIFVAGYTLSNDGDASGQHGGFDMLVAKLDNSGNLLWTKALGGTMADIAWGVVPTADGGCAVGGQTGSFDGDATGGGNHGLSPGLTDFWIVKLDAGGALQWQKCYGGSLNEFAYSIANTPDGGFLLGGSTNSTDGQVTCPKGYYDAWVIKTSSTGVLQWQKTLGGLELDEAHSVNPTADGGAIVAVYTGSKELPGYHPDVTSSIGDFYIVKLIPNTIPVGVPTITVNPPPLNICSGAKVTLQTTGVNLSSNVAYQWLLNGFPVGNNAPTYTASNFKNGDNVYCTATSTNSTGCDVVSSANITSNTVFLNVSPLVQPAVHISADAPVLCAGGTLNFTAVVTNGAGAPVYQWVVNGGPAPLATNSPTYSSSTLASGDVVSCSYSDNTACFSPGPSVSNTLPVQVTADVTPAVSVAASSTSVCMGSPATFTATPMNGGAAPAYQWLVNGALAAGSGNGPSYTSSALAPGDVVSCVLSSNAACAVPAKVASTGVAITVNPVTASSVAVSYLPADVCSGKPVVFSAVPTSGGLTPVYQWQVNGALAAGSGNGPSYTSSTLAPGDVVSCQLSDPVGCILPSAATVTPTVNPSPTVAMGQPVSLAKGQGVILNLSPTGDISHYAWSPVAGLSDPTIPDPVATPLATTTYTLTVTTAEGCEASGNVTVYVFSKVAIPGAFTPNGDGRNDIFYILGGPQGSRVKDFAVYNRWGQRVFHVADVAPDDPAFGWNGRVGGNDAPTGAYIYEILIVLADGTHQVYKGTVMLVR